MQILQPRASERMTETFTGEVFSDVVLPASEGVRVQTVTFTPGARTHWHTHERGQLLFVVSGGGHIRVRGQDAQPLRAGDTVWIPPDEEHWHGAGPGTLLVHTAVSLGETRWLEPVADADYV
jgi:quercetin dioxygenase-like cupin family protein